MPRYRVKQLKDPQVDFRPDHEGVMCFVPLNPSLRATNMAFRYNRFLAEWVTSGSVAEAVRKSNLGARGDATAFKLRKRFPHILDEVKRRRAALAKKIDLTQESVVLELARLAFSNIGRVVAWEDGKPTVVDSEMLDDDTIAAIQEISTNADGNIKIKMYDKKGALVDLGKFMGLGDSEGAHLTALLARLAGASDGEIIEAQKLDSRETARRVALLLRKGRALTKA